MVLMVCVTALFGGIAYITAPVIHQHLKFKNKLYIKTPLVFVGSEIGAEENFKVFMVQKTETPLVSVELATRGGGSKLQLVLISKSSPERTSEDIYT